MRLFLVHHGEAVTPDVDPQRPLSSQGQANTTTLAAEAARRGVRPVVVWHSGKLRARQTAESFWRACNPLAEFAAVRGLQPGDPPEWMRDRLIGESRDIMCVGHMPNLARLFEMLRGDGVHDFPTHGVVALEPSDERVWVECWRLEPPRR